MAYAPKDERTAPPAAMIAIAHIQLAAPGLSLGSTFTGSINTAAQGYPPMMELLGLPEGFILMEHLQLDIRLKNTSAYRQESGLM